MGAVEMGLKGFRNLVDVRYSCLTFSYSLKHNAIQRRTNTFGYTVLLTNTQFPANKILKIYREKDIVEKAFSHVKPRLEPFFSRTEEGTGVRLFLTIPGYMMIVIMAVKCNTTYSKLLETISGIREVVYANGSHAHVEYTKEQRELLEKLRIES
jgi:transposase